MLNERYKRISWYIIIFAGLFAVFQTTSKFTFFYIEQTQLFLFSWPYIWENLFQPGGFTLLIGEFLGQFYVLEYAGAIISAGAITLAGVLTSLLIHRISHSNNLVALPLLVVVSLLCISFDFNYNIQGTISLILVLCSLLGYLKIEKIWPRMTYAATAVIILFLLAGPFHILFAVCIVIWEALTRQKYWYIVFATALLSVLISYITMCYALFYGEPRFAFLPIGYFSKGVPPQNNILLLTLPLAVIVAYLFRNSKSIRLKTEVVVIGVQLLIVIFLGWKGVDKYRINEFYDVLELDHYAHKEQWDKIIERAPKLHNNKLNMCNLNMALAQKGELLERMFSFEQHDAEGLVVLWDMTNHIAILLSDISFTIGQISTAQEMAFESSVINSFSNARMLKRLVETNLIYGHYLTAEKYLKRMEKSLFYRKWAKEYRYFLYNDQAIESDSLLGAKRTGLLPKDQNFLSSAISYQVLQKMVLNNPSNQKSLEYFVALSLLSNNMALLKFIFENTFGTEALKELPICCQEAVLAIYGPGPEIISHYGISEQGVDNFNRFDTARRLVRSRSSVTGLKQQFGNTYWYYNVISDKN